MPYSLRSTARLAWQRRSSWFAFAVAFRVLDLAVFLPVLSWLLRVALQRWGRASVGNLEIVSFLASGPGLAALVGVGAAWLALRYVELAGLMKLIAHPLPWWRGLASPAGSFPRLLLLGMLQIVIVLAAIAPFLATIYLAYLALWDGHDLYGLIRLKTPRFWLGAIIAAALVAGGAIVAALLIARWALALPILLFGPARRPLAALRAAAEHGRGHRRAITAILLGWVAFDLLLSATVLGTARWGSDWLLNRVGPSLSVALPVTGALLTLHALLIAGLAIVGWGLLAVVGLALYREFVGEPATVEPPASPSRLSVPRRWLIVGGLLGLGTLATLGSLRLISELRLVDPVEVTAHRAGAERAPENTLAALRLAIEDRANWCEIDVVRTADDAVVVSHDIDLKRLGGGSVAVRNVTLEQIQQLDVGTAFGFAQEFAGERVPTLAEFLAASKGKMKLNIELKPVNRQDEDRLTRLVIDQVRAADFVAYCRICSQSYPSLQLVKELEPTIEVGFIAGKTLGDITALDVDFLMVSIPLATDALIARASAREMEVHVWSIKEMAVVSVLTDRGVANIITDRPAQVRATLEEIGRLNPLERILLRARNELAD